MDPETVAELRSAHESSIMLLTLLMEQNGKVAADYIYENPHLFRGPTCMATAMIAVGAFKTLAEAFDVDPMELVQIAGVSAAKMVVDYETGEKP